MFFDGCFVRVFGRFCKMVVVNCLFSRSGHSILSFKNLKTCVFFDMFCFRASGKKSRATSRCLIVFRRLLSEYLLLWCPFLAKGISENKGTQFCHLNKIVKTIQSWECPNTVSVSLGNFPTLYLSVLEISQHCNCQSWSYS